MAESRSLLAADLRLGTWGAPATCIFLGALLPSHLRLSPFVWAGEADRWPGGPWLPGVFGSGDTGHGPGAQAVAGMARKHCGACSPTRVPVLLPPEKLGGS